MNKLIVALAAFLSVSACTSEPTVIFIKPSGERETALAVYPHKPDCVPSRACGRQF